MPSPDVLRIEVAPGSPEEQAKQAADIMLRPSMQARNAVSAWGSGSMKLFDVGFTELVGALQKQGVTAASGDLQQLEAMLAVQAHTLDIVFNEMARVARLNLFQNLQAAETFLRLGLKAQSQCRATIETLGIMKNPPAVAFVKQANIASGHQQVNNGSAAAARANQFPSNELLERPNERLECGPSIAAGISNTQVATLGPVHRPKDRGRQETIEPEQPQTRSQVAGVAGSKGTAPD